MRPDQVRNLPPEQAAELLETIQASLAQTKEADAYLFLHWLQEVSPTWTWDWPYLLFIQKQLARVTSGEIKRLALFIPPRHGKTELTTVRYPVWRLERDPSLRVVIGAYNQVRANSFSRKSRRIAERRLQISGERKAVEEWETESGGGLRAVGVGTGIAGQGGDLIVLDDPIKNREEAESPAYRDRVWDWYTDDIYTRLEPDASMILIQTRWHMDDLAGRILESEDGPNWTVINLPAEAEENDPLGRKPGEALCPERYDLEALAERKRVLQMSYYALYQQRPVPREGALYKKDWFAERYVDLGDMYRVRDRSWPHKQCLRFVVMDPAGGISDSADYTAIVTFALTPENDLLILRVRRERIPLEEIVNALFCECRDMRPVVFAAVEKGFFQNSLIRQARKVLGMPPIRELDPEGKSKMVRALPAIAKASEKKILLPDAAEWDDQVLTELLRFTGGDKEKNDVADTISYSALILEQGWLGGHDAMPLSFGGR